MWVRAANIGDEDIYLKPRSMIGTVSFCDVEGDNSDIGFNRVGNTEEIFIQPSHAINEITLPETPFDLPEDIFQLDCSEEEKSLITSLFRKHREVFSKDDDDIGCTSTVTH